MGIKCIKQQDPSQKDPIFLYQNMVNSIRNIPITKQYQFLDKIGKGSYSQVFKARSFKTGKIYAIKKIFRKNQKIQQTLLNQFSILKQIDHPNILKMYEMFEEEKFFYITTELCQGKQLFDVIIKQKYFKQNRAREIFYQIISAINYLHNHKIMHRDLKPQNIMFDSQRKTLKIVDFGSAIQFASNQLQQRKRIGTSYYIAPEVLKKFYNQKCDIWSLGIILFIFLSGQPPFKGKDDQQILANVMNGHLQFKKSIWNIVSENAKDLIRKMLNRNPLERLSALQVLKHKWFQGMERIVEQSKDLDVQESLSQVLQNMKKFKDIKSSSIQQGMLIFIVNFVQNNKDEAQLMKCFKALDLDNDGVLSLQQLTKGLSKHLKVTEKQANKISEKIFKKVDTNNSGYIDYSCNFSQIICIEFLIAATNLQLAINQQNLDTAFNYLDQDSDGKLTIEQIRKKLGKNVSEQKYKKLLKKYDKNNDGYISREQFISMMKQMLKS